MIVPDTIEPNIGWKSLIVDNNGFLHSPQQSFMWKGKKRNEAECHNISYRWYARRGKDPEVLMAERRATANMAFPTTATSFSTRVAMAPIPSQPAVELPDGMRWSWEPYHHEAASVNVCSCGIYMVDHPSACHGYMHTEQSVLVKVAGWGHVIRGQYGARVQYAYPQLIVAPESLRDLAELAADRYGIPAEIVPDTANPEEPIETSSPEAVDVIQGNPFSLVTGAAPELPELSPFMSMACVSAVLATVTLIAHLFTKGSHYDGYVKVTCITSVTLVILCLLIDFLVFVQQEKSKQ